MDNVISMKLRFILVLLVTLVLSACGNSENENDEGQAQERFKLPSISDQPLTISSDNERTIVNTSFEAASGGIGSHNFGPFGVAMKSYSGNQNLYARIKNLVLDAIVGMAVNTPDQVDSEPLQCPGGGTLVTTGNVEINSDFTLFSGDGLHLIYHDCIDENANRLNGELNVFINRTLTVSDIVAGVDFNLDVSADFSEFSADHHINGKIIVDGDMRIEVSYSINKYDFGITGSSVYIITEDNALRLTDYNIDVLLDLQSFSSVIDSTYSIGTLGLGGTIAVDAYLETSGLGAFPNTGYINITGDSTLLIVDVIDSLKVSLTLADDKNVQQGYPLQVMWSDLGVAINNVF